MNIKSLLIGSVAALAAVSGAQAADAIVAAEPEAVEYVRVCDAFGTGFFYIPGTETCLKLGGYVRVQLNVGNTSDSALTGITSSNPSDYDIFARGRLNVDARNDTELGTLTSFFQLRGNASEGNDKVTGAEIGNSFTLEQAYIDLAGVRVGKFYSWWDDGIAGETDTLGTDTLFASARYTYTGEAFSAGLSVEELEHATGGYDVGVTGMLSGAFGPVKATLLGSYDIEAEEFAIRGIATAAVGPGTLGFAAVYASGANEYYSESEWAIAAEYAFKATDKLTITPAAQYFGDVAFGTNDAYKLGLTLDYAVTSGLAAKATVNYYDEDNKDGVTTGFLRIERSF